MLHGIPQLCFPVSILLIIASLLASRALLCILQTVL